jgi:glycerol kinase
MKETTALGAAYASGLAVGFWDSPEELIRLHPTSIKFRPTLSQDGMSRSSIYFTTNSMTIHRSISSR